MTKINTCEIINQVDNKSFTVYVEWLNSHLKIILVESTMPPLSGEMDTKDIDYYSEQLGKSCDEYLQEIKDIFCGKDKEIQFYIQEKTLELKKKEIWILAKITLRPILDTIEFSVVFQQLLKLYQSIQDKISILEEENKSLKDTNTDLNSKINTMIESKTVLEQDLYHKFILILNSKKEKIRNLEAIMKEKQSTTKSAFDADTDVSEESDENDKKLDDNRTKNKKRKSLDNGNPESTRKAKKKDSIANKNNIDNNKAINNKASVNKVINHSTTVENESILEEQSCSSTTKASRSSLNFVEEEIADELFS